MSFEKKKHFYTRCAGLSVICAPYNILVTRTIYFTWRVVRGSELLRMSRACLREREEGSAPCDIYS